MSSDIILDAVAIERRVKRAKILSEIMMGLVVLNCICSVILVTTMYQMGSRFDVLSQLFGAISSPTRGTENMFYTDVLDSRVENMRSLEWAFVQRYIEERVFSIPDQTEMFRRWGFYGNRAMMSHPRVFSGIGKSSDDSLKNIEMTLPVHAENIRYVSHIGHHWTVTYDECTQIQANSISCRTRRVNIAVGFAQNRRQFRPYPGVYYNPLGMIVYDWKETDFKS